MSFSDEQLAEKLRIDNIDQFNILVKMHLSFVLDLHTDDNDCLQEKGKAKKWRFVPFGKKSKFKGIMDGAPLTQEGICVVYQLIEFLKKEPNICVEGIFRRTGSLARQQELRNLLNQGMTIVLEGGPYSVHDCASVLKGFLAELPEPLLTEAHHSAYCQLAETYGGIGNETQKDRMLTTIQLLLLLLPTENRILLRDVLQMLNLTASYESNNKMSADSLATLFTPHLLCPRKLTPETLHISSQTLAFVLSFMITHCAEIFRVPGKLAVDIRAYYKERERKKILSPQKLVNESVSDNFAANTVFSFVDHERTAKENSTNPTETALAQLYAHIQSLPESSKKRRLVKQFNKENGHGTPLQVLRSNMPKQNKSISDSIKKHIFQKGLVKSVRKAGFRPLRASSDDILNTPQQSTSRSRLFCAKCESSSDVSSDDAAKKCKQASNIKTKICCDTSGSGSLKRSRSEPDISSDESVKVCNTYLTSTPACVARHKCPEIFTPEDQERKSMSPITRSTQRMPRAMQETMMTPRSRKPVLLVSGTNINNLPKLEKPTNIMDDLEEETGCEKDDIEKVEINPLEAQEMNNLQGDDHNISNNSQASLTSTFREYLCSRSMLTASPTDLSFLSRTDDYTTDIQDISESKLTESLLNCLNGNDPDHKDDGEESSEEKEFVLKPKQFDENGKPTVFETSF